MSTRRSSRSRPSRAPKITDDQISDHASKLLQLLPAEVRRCSSDKLSASMVLEETCNYIRSLHREVDNLSDRLSELLESDGSDPAAGAIIRSIMMMMM